MSYFSSKQFNELNGFSFNERQQIISIAQSKLSVPEKLILNLLKLVLLIPLFWMLSTSNWLGFVITTIIVFTAYIMVVRPLNLKFLTKYIEAAVAAHNKLMNEDMRT